MTSIMKRHSLLALGYAAIALGLIAFLTVDLKSANATEGLQSSQKVTIGNFTFKPEAVTVPVGTELIWVNEDDVPHIVIGTDADSPIKSQPLDTDDRYSVTLTKPGTYKYFCSMHPHM